MSIQSICVYTGSSIRVDEIYKDASRQLGKMIADRGMQLVYGGGHVGLMGLIADAALEAGGKVVGIIPSHLQKWEVQPHAADGIAAGRFHAQPQTPDGGAVRCFCRHAGRLWNA